MSENQILVGMAALGATFGLNTMINHRDSRGIVHWGILAVVLWLLVIFGV